MKFFVLFVVLTVQAFAGAAILPVPPENRATLSEAELSQLTPGTNLDDIRERLGFYTHTEVSAPLIIFFLREDDDHVFMLYYIEGTQEVLSISKFRFGDPDGSTIVQIWPRKDELDEIKEANQPADPSRL